MVFYNTLPEIQISAFQVAMVLSNILPEICKWFCAVKKKNAIVALHYIADRRLRSTLSLTPRFRNRARISEETLLVRQFVTFYFLSNGRSDGKTSLEILKVIPIQIISNKIRY